MNWWIKRAAKRIRAAVVRVAMEQATLEERRLWATEWSQTRLALNGLEPSQQKLSVSDADENRGIGLALSGADEARVNRDQNVDSTSMASVAEPAVESRELHRHPQFGQLLCDLGFKKLFLASVRGLTELPVWEKQRAYRHERAENIATEKMRGGLPRGFPGVITAFEMTVDGRRGILDGQHRRGALNILSKRGAVDPHEEFVIVEVFPLDDLESVDSLFREINKAEPLQLVDMPGAAPELQLQVLADVTEQLVSSYPTMFSSTSRCRIPHLHADSFRNDLFQAGILDEPSLRSAEGLMRWLTCKNQQLSQLSDAEWVTRSGKRAKTLTSALSKARKYNFFLGLDKQWMSEE